ncbi:hypothetical protein VSR34_38000, partial [Paraburkholderia sp. JHI2823]|uniref:hypothetical protein n=1 Tax=Paraburkholderia sp. JHI2823 TaxID=3112960 RepID=UPI00317A11F2
LSYLTNLQNKSLPFFKTHPTTQTFKTSFKTLKTFQNTNTPLYTFKYGSLQRLPQQMASFQNFFQNHTQSTISNN